MYSYLVNNSAHKKAKAVTRNASATISLKMFLWIKNVWDIQWIGFKVKIIK